MAELARAGDRDDRALARNHERVDRYELEYGYELMAPRERSPAKRR